MALYKIRSSRVNNIDANQYTGSAVEEGLIWYDPSEGLLRLYDGNVGGQIINYGGGGGNPISVEYNGHVVTSNVSSINFTGNAVSVTGYGSNVTVNIDQTPTPTNIIELGNSNVQVWPDGNVTISIRGNANAAVFSNPVAVFDNLIVTGLETAGNIRTDALSAAGNVTAAYFIGDGRNLTNISAANVTGTVANAAYANIANFASTANIANFASTANTANFAISANTASKATVVTASAQPNITSVGTLSSLSVSGNIRAVGNITGNYLYGNGYYLTGVSGGGGASFPTQAGNAGLVLMTDGTSVYWNSGLASSYTFEGGQADSSDSGATLDGGGAASDYTGEAIIFGGSADSDYSLTLSSLALTGQYQDLIDSPAATPVPATSTSPGQKGQMAFDNSYLYVCVVDNTWRRASLNSW